MVTVGYITFDDCPMISDICEPYCSHGQHVSGTDGMDYQHRERVASQYAVSATNKTRLKRLVLVHYMLGAAHLARLLPSLIKLLNLEIVMPLPPTPPSSFIGYCHCHSCYWPCLPSEGNPRLVIVKLRSWF